MCMFWWWFSGFGVLVGAVALAFLVPTVLPSLLAVLVAVGAVGSRVAIWQHDKLCLSNSRIFVVRGWTNLKIEMMPLNKMANESLYLPVASRLLGWARWITIFYGTIIADAAGEEDLLGNMPFIPGAMQVNILIANRVLGD
jgi:hypothetical protein